ncbi:MAG TPA: phosphatidylglycerophosphatase A [Vicinamibacterales bacterium]|nr:phosphatidylglycerophosphatase A [Vicinamibacterales bacterium]
MKTRLAVFVCTFGYIGYAPIAPGTVGSLAGLLVHAALRWFGVRPLAEAVVIVMLFVIGTWSGTIAERHFGGTDPGPGVIDEVVGMLMTLYLVPTSWIAALTGFFVFRVLDVVKPFPAGRLERLPGGLGMMADDAMSAVYGNVLMQLLAWTAASQLGG